VLPQRRCPDAGDPRANSTRVVTYERRPSFCPVIRSQRDEPLGYLAVGGVGMAFPLSIDRSGD
jgi:hypothetical protein